MEALMFEVSFETAQFRKHLVKLYRDTYLIPLPSSVLGFIGAVLGVRRRELGDFACSNGVMTGAAILSYEGTVSETMTLIKLKDWQQLIRTPKRNILLYRPRYIFALSSPNSGIVKELEERLLNLDFEFDVYGGNDYNFLLDLGGVRRADYRVSKRGVGYCRLSDLEGTSGSGEIRVEEVNDGEVTKYAFSMGPTLELSSERSVVTDGKYSVFVHESWRFLR